MYAHTYIYIYIYILFTACGPLKHQMNEQQVMTHFLIHYLANLFNLSCCSLFIGVKLHSIQTQGRPVAVLSTDRMSHWSTQKPI